jgi:hypothetical protein
LMFDVEAGLADGVEPNDQFSQARRPGHEDDFVVSQTIHKKSVKSELVNQ